MTTIQTTVYRLNLPQRSFLSDVIRQPLSQGSMTPTTVSTTICDGLDRFEGINAAEWDEVPESQSLAKQQAITPTRRLKFGKMENEMVRLSTYLRDQIHSMVNRSMMPLMQLFRRFQPVLVLQRSHSSLSKQLRAGNLRRNR